MAAGAAAAAAVLPRCGRVELAAAAARCAPPEPHRCTCLRDRSGFSAGLRSTNWRRTSMPMMPRHARAREPPPNQAICTTAPASAWRTTAMFMGVAPALLPCCSLAQGAPERAPASRPSELPADSSWPSGGRLLLEHSGGRGGRGGGLVPPPPPLEAAADAPSRGRRRHGLRAHAERKGPLAPPGARSNWAPRRSPPPRSTAKRQLPQAVCCAQELSCRRTVTAQHCTSCAARLPPTCIE